MFGSIQNRNEYFNTLLQPPVTLDRKGNTVSTPKYHPGTFFPGDRIPRNKKYADMFKAIIGRHAAVFFIEGGVRAGKDVLGINAYSQVLMSSEERLHLVLGTSLEHALKTVYDSNGFGLKYLLPHGEFIRSTEDGAQRGVFKFQDMYGREKEVHFYGNMKKNDFTKFQGFTFGSVYINEAINQHINGLHEALQRTSSVKDRIVLMTGNPVGSGHPFYTKFEKPFLLNSEEREFIKNLQQNDVVMTKFLEDYDGLEEERKRMLAEFTKQALNKFEKSKVSELNDKEHMVYIDGAFEISSLYEGQKRDLTVDKYIDLDEEHGLHGLSMFKLMNYVEGGANPNDIYNGYDYRYYHFTVKDNAALTKLQIREHMNSLQKGTALYDQRILGKRVSSDDIVFPEFTTDNILEEDIEFYHRLKPDAERFIAIDPGANHPTGIVDCDVDFRTGEIWQLGERLLELKDYDVTDRSFTKIEKALWEVINSRPNKRPAAIIVDPSNTFLISYLRNKNFNVIPANNKTQSARSKDMVYADNTIKKREKGIDLMRTMFHKLKLMIHHSCINTIGQLQTYSSEFNETTGREEIIPLNDDLVDPLKYVANTTEINPSLWEEANLYYEEDEQEAVRSNEEAEDEAGNMARIQQGLNQRRINELLGHGRGQSSNSLYGRKSGLFSGRKKDPFNLF